MLGLAQVDVTMDGQEAQLFCGSRRREELASVYSSGMGSCKTAIHRAGAAFGQEQRPV